MPSRQLSLFGMGFHSEREEKERKRREEREDGEQEAAGGQEKKAQKNRPRRRRRQLSEESVSGGSEGQDEEEKPGDGDGDDGDADDDDAVLDSLSDKPPAGLSFGRPAPAEEALEDDDDEWLAAPTHTRVNLSRTAQVFGRGRGRGRGRGKGRGDGVGLSFSQGSSRSLAGKKRAAPGRKKMRALDEYESTDHESSSSSSSGVGAYPDEDDDDDDDFMGQTPGKRTRKRPSRQTRSRTFGRRSDSSDEADGGAFADSAPDSDDDEGDGGNSVGSSGSSGDSSYFSVESDSDEGPKKRKRRRVDAEKSPPGAKKLALQEPKTGPAAGMSEFERRRAERIAQNAAMLASLGLGTLGAEMGRSVAVKSKPKAKKPTPRQRPPPVKVRSYRLRRRRRYQHALLSLLCVCFVCLFVCLSVGWLCIARLHFTHFVDPLALSLLPKAMGRS
jgi:hypothetical protein